MASKGSRRNVEDERVSLAPLDPEQALLQDDPDSGPVEGQAAENSAVDADKDRG